MIKDIIRGAALVGYNKFILFFGHGQAFMTNYTVQELGLEGYFVVSIMFQNMVKDVHNQTFQTPFWHADEAETSVGLYTHPQYVDMSKAAKETSSGMIDSRFIQSPSEASMCKPCRFDEGTFSMPEYKDLKLGIIGDATIASRDKGEKYVQAVVERTVEFIQEIKTKFPAGIKPPVK